MHMSSYLLPFLDTGIEDICIYLSILIDIPYLDDEKLSMKNFFSCSGTDMGLFYSKE